MQVTIETAIDIDAPAALVWSVLLDFDAYARWNPFMVEIRGSTVPGARLAVTVRPPGSREMRFRAWVTKVCGGRELRWRGRFLMPGLFDGEHYFRLAGLGTARTRVTHGEAFSGALVRFARTGLIEPTRRGFEAMNTALKDRAESRRSPLVRTAH